MWPSGPADCAERTLSLFEARAPGDTRPHDAIDGLRAFARSELRIGGSAPCRSGHAAAHARGAATYAAKAAGLAALISDMHTRLTADG